MGKWILWMILSRVMGSPVIAGVVVLALYVVLDRFTLGLLPSPFRWFKRWQRRGQLQKRVAALPFDRKARSELADLELDMGHAKIAYETLRPNFEAGDHDVYTSYTLGTAAYRAGLVEEAEALLVRARGLDEKFRFGAIDLELGRGRLAAKNYAGAVDAFEKFLLIQTRSVEGKVLLARAKRGLGESAAAAKWNDAAWADHRASHRYQQRMHRWWAWRAKPERPLIYIAIVVVGMVLVQQLVPWAAITRRVSIHRPPPQAVDNGGVNDDD